MNEEPCCEACADCTTSVLVTRLFGQNQSFQMVGGGLRGAGERDIIALDRDGVSLGKIGTLKLTNPKNVNGSCDSKTDVTEGKCAPSTTLKECELTAVLTWAQAPAGPGATYSLARVEDTTLTIDCDGQKTATGSQAVWSNVGNVPQNLSNYKCGQMQRYRFSIYDTTKPNPGQQTVVATFLVELSCSECCEKVPDTSEG